MSTAPITLSSSTGETITAGSTYGPTGHKVSISNSTDYVVYGDSTAASTIKFATSTVFNELVGSYAGTAITGSSTYGNILIADGGAESLTGGAGNDELVAVTGTVKMTDGNGNDDITVGSTATATITAGTGDDFFSVSGAATIASINNAADTLYVAAGGSVTVSAIDAVTGTTGGWVATAATTNDGAVTIDTKGVAVNLSAATGAHGFTVVDSKGATTIVASNQGDTITGAKNDTITGGTGIDTYTINSTETLTNLGINAADKVNVVTGATLTADVVANYTANGNLDNNGKVSFIIDGNSVNAAGAAGTGTYTFTDSSMGTTDTLTGSANGNTFNINSGTDTVNFGTTADVLTVASGATANVNLDTAGFTATKTTDNLGTANLTLASTATGVAVNLAAVKAGNGFNLTDLGHGNTLTGSTGLADTITGGANDTINAGTGSESIVGSAGGETINTGKGADTITSGHDTIIGGAGTAVITSTGYDSITGSTGADTINSGGNDTIIGGKGADTINGAAGDMLTEGKGVDTFNINAGTETITNLNGTAAILNVASGATVDATVTATWTATAASVNDGTANITTSGFAVNLANIVSGNGFNVTDHGSTAVKLTGTASANDTFTDLNTAAKGDTMIGGAGTDTFTIGSADTTGILGTITNLNGADNLYVYAGETADATISSSWTATSATDNLGTANLAIAKSTGGFDVNLSAVASGHGFSLTDSGTGNNTIIGSNNGDTITGAAGDSITGGTGANSYDIAKNTVETITDLGNGSSDTLVVATGATVNADLSANWTATSGSSNAGTVDVMTNGHNLTIGGEAGVWNITDSGDTLTIGTGFSVGTAATASTIDLTSGTETLVYGSGVSAETVTNYNYGTTKAPAYLNIDSNGNATFTVAPTTLAAEEADIVKGLGVHAGNVNVEFTFGTTEYLLIAGGESKAETALSTNDSLIKLTGVTSVTDVAGHLALAH